MRTLALAFALLLSGCASQSIPDEWSPLTTVIERPTLPFASDTAITTKGSHVYTTDLDQFNLDYPPGSIEYAALMMHEREHARRQFRYLGLPGEFALTAWVTRYVTDSEFRLEEEQRAYYLDIRHLAANGRWSAQDTLRQASGMAQGYHGMISFAEAKAWIEDVLAGRWTPR